MRYRAAPERLSELVRPAGPRLADDEDRVRRHALRIRPLEEQARDLVMEELVGWTRRPEHVVVNSTPADGIEDRVTRGRIALLAPCDQERAARVRVKATSVVEQLAVCDAAMEPLPG